MSAIAHEFEPRSRVIIDGDRSLVAVVLGLYYCDHGLHEVKVAWIIGGKQEELWVSPWRLELVKGSDHG